MKNSNNLSICDALSRMSNIVSNNNIFDSFFNDFFSEDFPTSWVEVSDYPKYNIIDNSTETEKILSIEMAVAGFSKDEVKISSVGNVLTIEAEKQGVRDVKYVNKGIAERSFKWSRTLPKYSKIGKDDISLNDGILTINIHIDIPAAEKEIIYEIK